MTAAPDDLATWLLEQIAEDERIAGGLPADGYPKHGSRVLSVEGTMDVPWPDRWNPVRVLAECDAKRRIVKLHEDAGRSQGYTDSGYGYHEHACGTCGAFGEYGRPWPCATLRLLALPYADRPGYREEWAP